MSFLYLENIFKCLKNIVLYLNLYSCNLLLLNDIALENNKKKFII